MLGRCAQPWVRRRRGRSSIPCRRHTGYAGSAKARDGVPTSLDHARWSGGTVAERPAYWTRRFPFGGSLIKAGQFASVRPDLIPATCAQALARLQDRVPPHSWSTIEAVIRRELGRSIDDVFDAVEPRPVAAASLARVHRAWLVDSREVASGYPGARSRPGHLRECCQVRGALVRSHV